MSSENSALWDILGRTDPAHTKEFTRGGGFKGTAIKPIWSYKRMTDEFGPCGVGWGVSEPSFQVVQANEEILVFCTAHVWFKRDDRSSESIFGVGGDKVLGKNKYGLNSDDEAFKKAYTDAITNALKMIGVGADVHMGMFEDNKYVPGMRREFADEPEQPAAPVKSSAQLKREGSWEAVISQLHEDFVDCHSMAQLEQLKVQYREKCRAGGWNRTYMEQLAEEFEQKAASIKKSELLLSEEDFPGDRPSAVDLKNNAYARAVGEM